MNNILKRQLAISLALMMSFCLVACNNENDITDTNELVSTNEEEEIDKSTTDADHSPLIDKEENGHEIYPYN